MARGGAAARAAAHAVPLGQRRGGGAPAAAVAMTGLLPFLRRSPGAVLAALRAMALLVQVQVKVHRAADGRLLHVGPL